MKNFFPSLFVTITVSLTACGGGSSDSSGSSNNISTSNNTNEDATYELRFNSLPRCQVDMTNKIISAGRYVPDSGYINPVSVDVVPQECKVKLPELNGGLTFSLRCNSYTASYVVFSGEKSHIDELSNMIKTGQPYLITCNK